MLNPFRILKYMHDMARGDGERESKLSRRQQKRKKNGMKERQSYMNRDRKYYDN